MPDRPNLLLIFTDQQRADTMRCYGNSFVTTPNLDALAARSFVFENAYVSQPVCTPSRSTILTGQWPHTNGCVRNNVALQRETPTLAEMAPANAATGYIGKWHLGDEITAQHGFETWVSIEDYYRAHYSDAADLERRSDYHRFLLDHGFEPNAEKEGGEVFSRRMAANMPVEFTKASFTGGEAARFLREKRDSQFVLCVNFLEPHSPYMGKLGEQIDPDAVPLGPHFLTPPDDDASGWHRFRAAMYGAKNVEDWDLRQEAGWRNIRARYLGNVNLVDRAVGEILAALEESGQADNTIVAFTSDHGDMLGDHGTLAKCVMYEEAVRVPLLIHVPWLSPQGQRVPGRISQIDLAPTLLDLLGQPLPDHLQGVSRTPVLTGDDSLADNDVVIEWSPDPKVSSAAKEVEGFSAADIERLSRQHWRTIISADGWKLTIYTDDRDELYNLNTDPDELTNRIDDPALEPRLAELTERLLEWQRQTKDELALPTGDK